MAWDDVLAKIKLPGGTVGKICLMLIAVSLAFAAMVVSVRVPWVACVGISLLAIVVLVLGLAVVWFAHKHPQAALMEGAEFLQHEQIEQMKNRPPRRVRAVDKTPKGPLPQIGQEQLLLDQPEEDSHG